MSSDPSRRAFVSGAAMLSMIPAEAAAAGIASGPVEATFESRAAAAAGAVSRDAVLIATAGFARPGDGGEGLYRRLPGAPPGPSNPAYFRDASGAWFALAAAFGQDLNVRMFGCRGDGVADDQAAFQAAIDYAFASFVNLHVPAGLYQVDQLMLPARTDPPRIDDRHKRFKLYGQGIGEGYALYPYSETGGTKIRGGRGKAVLVPHPAYRLGGGSGLEICDIAWIGNSGTGAGAAGIPVVDLRIVQNSSFHHNILYQEGDGDGLQISMAYQADIAFNRIINHRWMRSGTGAALTGVGIRLLNPHSPSQVTIRNNTSRSFHDAGILGDPSLANREYQLLFLYNEASGCYNGWTFHGCDGGLLLGNYVEGAEGGFGFRDASREASYLHNFVFEGTAVGIDLSSPDSRGAKLIGNTIKLGTKANAVGIKLVNPNRLGWNATVRDNFIEKMQGTPGTVGILLAGPAFGVDVTGNEFNPRTAWEGADSYKLHDTLADEGAYGFVQRDAGDFSMPELANGAITLHKGVLTQDDAARGLLTLGSGTYFSMSAARPTAIDRIARTAGASAALIILNLKDGNVTLSNSGWLKLAGGAGFSGPGQIVFTVERLGGRDFAYEVSRTRF